MGFDWIERYNLDEDICKKIDASLFFHNIECEITKIIPSRVFVKIENEPRPASIYIGELTNKRIENINDFEYNGVKLHIGQKQIKQYET
jgi:hypothetical protein